MQLLELDNGEAFTDELPNQKWARLEIDATVDESRPVVVVLRYLRYDDFKKGLVLSTEGVEDLLTTLIAELDHTRCHQLRRTVRYVHLERDAQPAQRVLFAEFRPGDFARNSDVVLRRLERALARVKRQQLTRQRTARGFCPRRSMARAA